MPESSTRRDFVRALALSAPATSLMSGEAAAQKPEEKPGLSEVDARMELVLARYGKKLDPEARKLVRAEVEAIVGRVAELRKIPLTNADGPFPVFTPFRSPLA